jgi:hypothetical protein
MQQQFFDCYGNAWEIEYDATFTTAVYTALDTQPDVTDEEIVAQLVLRFPEEDLEELSHLIGCLREGWWNRPRVN